MNRQTVQKNTYMNFFYVKELPKNTYFVISVSLYPKELITHGKIFWLVAKEKEKSRPRRVAPRPSQKGKKKSCSSPAQ